jgi:hypothetical protein
MQNEFYDEIDGYDAPPKMPEFVVEQVKPSTEELKAIETEMAYRRKMKHHGGEYGVVLNPEKVKQDMLMEAIMRQQMGMPQYAQNQPSPIGQDDNALMRVIQRKQPAEVYTGTPDMPGEGNAASRIANAENRPNTRIAF